MNKTFSTNLLHLKPCFACYSPFGVALYGRSWSSEEYRYGFSGKEKESLYSSTGESDNSSYDFGARIYEGRLGRWMSVDKSCHLSLYKSPFAAFINNPNFFVDPDGRYDRHAEGQVSSLSHIQLLVSWEIKVNIEYRYLDHTNNPSAFRQQTNSEKLEFLRSEYKAKDQQIKELGANKDFSCNKDLGHYVICGGFPIDMHHFIRCAALAYGLPDGIVKWAARDEEEDQAEIDPTKSKQAKDGFSSAFSPEDMLSNYLGIYFGDDLNDESSLAAQMESFMAEVDELFRTNDVKNGKYLTTGRIQELRDISLELYDSDDLRSFNQDSDIYKKIETINYNAKDEIFPLTTPRTDEKNK